MNDPIIITFTDLKKTVFRHAFVLKAIAGVSFFSAFVFLIIKDPQFLAELSVQQIGKITEYKEDFTHSTENSALLKMNSSQVLKPVIEDLGLQMVMQKSRWNRWLENAKENIFYICSCSFKRLENFSFSYVNYEGHGEMPIFLQITSANTYQILSGKKKILAEGQIAEPISTPFFSVRIDQFPKQYKMHVLYYFILTPWKKVIGQLRAKLGFCLNKLEKNSFKIYFSDRDSALSTQVVNRIVQFYEKSISLEKDRLLNQTKDYFRKRKENVFEQLDAGFVDTTSSLATTTSKKKRHQEQLFLLKKQLGIHLLEDMVNMLKAQEMHLHYNATFLKKSPISLQLLPPHLMMYSLLFSFIGFLAGYFYFISKMIIRGVPVSHEGLMAAGIHSCGVLSSRCGCSLGQLSAADLKILRQICAFIESHKKTDRSLMITLMTQQLPDYTHALASLLALRGFKILVIDCSFNRPTLDNLPTFVQYLEGNIAQMPICHLRGYDQLSMGKTEYGFEWVAHPKFSSVLLKCKQYDLILLTTTIFAKEVEGQLFCKVADCVVVTTQTDSKQDLLQYIVLQKKQKPSFVTFVIIEGKC